MPTPAPLAAVPTDTVLTDTVLTDTVLTDTVNPLDKPLGRARLLIVVLRALRIVQVPHLEKRAVLAALQPPDVPRDLQMQPLQPLLERRALAVGVKAYKTQFATPGHHHVVVSRLLIVFVVTAVMMLVCLDAEQCIPDNSPVVHVPPVAAVAVRCGKRHIMHKVCEVSIEKLTHLELHAPPSFNFLMSRKLLAETPETMFFVMRQSYAPIRPISAYDTS